VEDAAYGTSLDHRLAVPSAPTLACAAGKGVGSQASACRVCHKDANEASEPASPAECDLASAIASRAKRWVTRARLTLGSWVSSVSTCDGQKTRPPHSSAIETLSASRRRLKGKAGDRCCESNKDGDGDDGGGGVEPPAVAKVGDPRARPGMPPLQGG